MDAAEQSPVRRTSPVPDATRLQGGAGTSPSLLLCETFQRACDYIASHYSDPTLDPRGIARQLGCSRATLYRAFQANEATVADHIQRVRFHQVQISFALSPARIPISSIAMDCGFECLRHFNRRFKQLFGDTPGAYRMAQRRATMLVRSTHGLALDQPPLVFHKAIGPTYARIDKQGETQGPLLRSLVIV
jgi:AraC-like DNA-binding protein